MSNTNNPSPNKTPKKKPQPQKKRPATKAKSAPKKPATKPAARPKTQARQQKKVKPMSRSERASFGWNCAIVLCVFLSIFAVMFASCSSGEVPDEENEIVETI